MASKFLGVEFHKNFRPQRNNDGKALALNDIGESFFPKPDKICIMSDGEFHGIDCEGVSMPAFAKLAEEATSESCSRMRTFSPLDIKV